LLRPVYITSDFATLLESKDRNNAWLYQLIFPDDTPPIIYPGSLSPEKLLDLALGKVRHFLRKDESKDFIQKRMMIANPGKELTIKNQLSQFMTRPTESLSALKHSGDSFVFWSNLCNFIRQDFTKKTDKTPEEIALLQAVFVTEYLNNHYKNKSQQNLQRETALKNLDLAFQKPPYYFDKDTIARFVDSRGVPLLGQYREEDLESWIKSKTGESGDGSLPEVLVFRTAANVPYFLLKEKIVTLSVKLCNDARKGIKDALIKEWYQTMLAYRQDDAMRSQASFEKKIESLCAAQNPILFALLNATFIPLLALEGLAPEPDAPNGFRMFDHGRLLPWSELLMLNRQELLTDARILLPFWYTIPVLSAIVAFFRRPRAAKKQSAKASAAKTIAGSTEDAPTGGDAQKRKAELRQAAGQVERRLIPAGSTIERELQTNLDQWNRNLDPDIKDNLTEDVNSLIRDYIRRTARTLKASTFNLDRVENLAQALVDSPGLMKVKNRDALLDYVKLYIVQILKNVG